MHVRLRQQALPVPGSPFKLTVRPGPAHAHTSRVPTGTVRGKVGGDASSGCSQTLVTSDRVGNKCISGGANVDVVVPNPSGVETDIADQGDGSYVLSWRSKASGTFKARVRIDGEDVIGSPLEVVLSSSTPELRLSELTGAGMKTAVSGEQSSFKIRFVDQFSNVAIPSGAFKFGLAIDKEKQKLPNVAECPSMQGSWDPPGDTGIYTLSYVATVAGTCALHVWCDPEATGERIAFPGSPFTLHVTAGEASAAISRVDGWQKISKEEK